MDIGLTPLGDGIIDSADLEVLMAHWGQTIDDPTLVPHWTLDETEGDIACDTTDVNDASVVGGAAWRFLADRSMVHFSCTTPTVAPSLTRS